MGPGGIALAGYRAAIGLFCGGRSGCSRSESHTHVTSATRRAGRPCLVVLLLFLLLRAASLPVHGDVERNPGPQMGGESERGPSGRVAGTGGGDGAENGESLRELHARVSASPDSGPGVTQSPDLFATCADGMARPGEASLPLGSARISVVTAPLPSLASASMQPSQVSSASAVEAQDRPPPTPDRCPVCSSVFNEAAGLWRHINFEHIARRDFPPAEFLIQHGRLLCSEATCSFAYSARKHTCQRAVGSGERCSGLLVNPRIIIAARALRHRSASGSREEQQPMRQRPSGPPPPPPPPPLRTTTGGPPTPTDATLQVSGSTQHPDHLPDFQHDPALAAVAAAAARRRQATADDAQAFRAIMDEIVTLPVGTVTHVPRSVRAQLAVVLTDCLRAARLEGLWGFVRLMLVAKAVLRSPPRGGRRKRYVVSACISTRLRRWQQGELVALWREARSDGLPRAATSGVESVASDNARRALRLATEGRYGDAMRALGSTGCASPADPAALQELQDRHPAAELPPSSDCPQPSLVVDEEAVMNALRSFPRGSSPGGSKLRAQHLADAISGTTAPAAADCQAELTRFVNLLLSGRADHRTAPWLVGAPVIGLLKPEGGLRPIAVGEVLRRLVGRVSCAAARSRLPDLFLPYGQVGVGVRGGLEAAVHSLRSFITAHGHKEDLCCLKLDMRNAFNECSRSAFLHRAREELPELFPWMQWCYCVAGELRFGHHRILSTAGVQQGDPLGPLLFSLVLLEVLDEVGGLDTLGLCVWYLDDGTVVGPRPLIRQFLDRLLAIGPKYGLFVKMGKTELYWPSGDQAFPEFPAAIVRVGPDQAGIELLGSPVFGSPDFYDDAVQCRVAKVVDAQHHLSDLDNPQVALHLLRSCLSLCKVNHLLRTVPAPLAASQWSRFDAECRAALGRIVHTSITDDAWAQATLPCRLGGLGLREAAAAHCAAFLGCCNSTRHLCLRLLNTTQRVARSAAVSSVPGEREARLAYAALGVIRPSTDLDLSTAGQHALQKCVDDLAHTALLARCSVRDRARLTACGTLHAAAWLRALPAPTLGLAMSRHDFVLALRLWLGIPVFSAVQRCPCRQLICRFGDHLLGCGHGPLRIRRHDALREVIFHALTNDCRGVRREQRCAADRQDRPGDVYHPSFQNGRPGYFDVSVRNSLQPAVLARGAGRAGVAAEAGVAAKDAHHEDAVADAGGDFYPLVVETLGVWAPPSLAILRLIASRAATHSGLSTGRAFCNLLQQLAVVLWTSNARMLRAQVDLQEDVPGWDLPA